MSKFKAAIPVILALLQEGVKLIKPIKDALVEEGGIGFRRRMKEFAAETTETISKNTEAIEKLATSTDVELDELRAEIEKLKKQLDKPEPYEDNLP